MSSRGSLGDRGISEYDTRSTPRSLGSHSSPRDDIGRVPVALRTRARMLTTADYVVIAFYFVFMTSMGWVFRRFIKDTSDYFRSGGEMLWWIVGAGAFMNNFSDLSFVAHAGKAYVDGPVVLVIFLCNAFAFLFYFFYFAQIFRKLLYVSAMVAVSL